MIDCVILILKYCGERISAQALTDAIHADAIQPTVASELRDVLIALTSTERAIADLVRHLGRSAARRRKGTRRSTRRPDPSHRDDRRSSRATPP